MRESCKYCSPNGWTIELSNKEASLIVELLRTCVNIGEDAKDMIKRLEKEL